MNGQHEKRDKEANRTRKISLNFRVSAEEYALIKQQMEQAGIRNIRAFLLKMALNGSIIRVELDSVKEMVWLLSNATNNINQIARRVNETGNLYEADINDLRVRYNEIWTQTSEILQRLSAL